MSDCKRCGGTGKVGMAVANPFGSHDYEWDDCPEYHPDGNTRLKIENASLRAEVERLGEELGISKMAEDMALAAAEEMEKENKSRDTAIQKALEAWENCGAQEHRDPQWGDTYIVDPASFGEIEEALKNVPVFEGISIEE